MNAKGTGLGLSICKNIIEQMGGNVEVESVLGKGTKFLITLNVKAQDKISLCSELVPQTNEQIVKFYE